MKKITFLVLIIVALIVIVGFFVFWKEKESNLSQKQVLLEETPQFQKKENKGVPMIEKEKIELITEDGVKIKGIWQKVEGEKAVLLLHMMPATKESWQSFSEFLAENNFSSLAIDLRGHGESRETLDGKELDYRYFSDSEHQKSILDLKVASKFLEERGFPLSNQYLVGASIGANLALEFLSLNPEISKAVLLSPGLDYRGLKTEKFLENIQKNQKILAVASRDDYYSFNSVEKLSQLAKEKELFFETQFYQTAGHGTDIFGKEKPDLTEVILNFLKEDSGVEK